MQFFLLTPSQPVEVDGHSLYELQCVTTFEKEIEHPSEEDLAVFGTIDLLLKAVPQKPGGKPEYGFVLNAGLKLSEDVLCAWLHGDRPDLYGWTRIQLRTAQVAQPQQQT
uniref:hypothetical protein n=1 Tax=Agathobacter sp. TaxID=2021311 RepID=UPI004057676D